MSAVSLTGAEKSRLRGRGQTLEAALKVGREGASPSVISSLHALLTAQELVKVRYTAADRDEREALSDRLAETTDSCLVGAVGGTALFYRPRPDQTAAPGA
jgi:RNA-binding protein